MYLWVVSAWRNSPVSVLLRLLAISGLSVFLAACSLPRGAALQSEILTEQDAANPTFAVVPVTRAAMGHIATWPVTGWSGRYHWPKAGRGPDSTLIRAGDVLDIHVWDADETSLLIGRGGRNTALPQMTVSASGEIFMPYVGKVRVRGLTPVRARDRIQDALTGISTSAQVQLNVTPGRNNAVDLVSGVGAPGRYTLENRDTGILSVLAQGGAGSTAICATRWCG